MKFSLALSIGVTAHLFDIPTCVSAFLVSPLLPLKPRSLLVTRTRITASLPPASFVPPWTQWTTGTTAVSEAALELQQKLRQSCSERSVENRGDRIKELAKELNALNPTRSPALSSSLEGKWKLIYSDIPGPSGGRVGPFSANVFQEIRSRDKRIVNTLELGPNRVLRGALEADVEVVDAKTWALVFDFVRGTFAGAQVQYKKFDASTERRIWCMTYLDDGFRVLYGRQESTSEDKAYIFIMERCDFKREGGGVV